MELFLNLLFICPLLLLAGIIDGIAGGGGIIALPAYIMTGMPLNVAYGCNKMQSCIGTGASLYRYARSGLVDFKAALFAAATALVGSHVSTRIMLGLDESIIKIIIAVAMCFIITLTFLTGKVRSGTVTRIPFSWRNLFICFAIGLVLGLYDGFFGPGGGTIALMLFTIIFKYDMRIGSGNGKLIIVVSNLTALINYIVQGSIWYQIAIPATVANVIGSYIGASLAAKKGTGLVKKILPVVVVLLIVQATVELVSN